MTTRQQLEATAARTRCALCHTQARVAWLPTGESRISGLSTHEYRLRCACYPKGPTLEKLPRSAVSRYLAGEEPADAIVKMMGDRILDKRRESK